MRRSNDQSGAKWCLLIWCLHVFDSLMLCWILTAFLSTGGRSLLWTPSAAFKYPASEPEWWAANDTYPHFPHQITCIAATFKCHKLNTLALLIHKVYTWAWNIDGFSCKQKLLFRLFLADCKVKKYSNRTICCPIQCKESNLFLNLYSMNKNI